MILLTLSRFSHLLMDCTFFLIVDMFVKWLIRDLGSLEEKRRVWLVESFTLMMFSVFIYMCDHTPYFLLMMTVLTFISTHMSFPDFRHYLHVMQTRWEEYQQHRESINLPQKQLLFGRASPEQKNERTVFSTPSRIQNERQQTNNWFYTNRQRNPNFNYQTNPNSVNFTQPCTEPVAKKNEFPYLSIVNKLNVFKKSPKPEPDIPEKPSQFNRNTQDKQFSSNFIPESHRQPLLGFHPSRRPLASVRQRNVGNVNINSCKPDLSQSLKDRFKQTFGFFNQPTGPPGLKNEGQNLCFMNSILQCIARTPKLGKNLNEEISKDEDRSVAASVLISTFCELISNCLDENSSSTLDPIAFRQAVSSINCELISPPSERQRQQDSAEFFMWLVETFHNFMNRKKQAGVRVGNAGHEENPKLKTLKFIYGHLNPAKIQDLKQACQTEINSAHGFKSNTYMEAIQRLVDLEWLSYKEENDSIINNLFTGQLVIVYHNLIDNKISVDHQTFNVLPVTMAKPRDVSGLVVLSDCFEKFGNIEQLKTEEDQNQLANAGNFQAESPIAHCTPQRRKRSSVDSAISVGSSNSVMSPIYGTANLQDSGFQDNVFKTSTPIGNGAVSPQAAPWTSNLQRRCLLCQLPECLVIQLIRFSYNQVTGLSQKLSTPVSIPLKTLDLKPIMFDTLTDGEFQGQRESCYKYDLYGICSHLGGDSTNYGHYVSYALQPESNKWFKFDDEMVTEVNMEYEMTTSELRQNAYLLFYKKCSS